MRWTPRALLLFALSFAALSARAADQSKSIPEIPESAISPTLAPQTPSLAPNLAPNLAPTAIPALDATITAPLAAAQAPAQAQAAKPAAQAQVQAAAKGAARIESALSPAKGGDATTAAAVEGQKTFDLAKPRDGGSIEGLPIEGAYSQSPSGLAPYTPRTLLAQEGSYTREHGLGAMLDEAVDRGDLAPAAKQAWLDTAYRDPLTGLRNRLYLEDHLGDLALANQSLITIKLDSLKEINDSYDHEVGNKFLKALGAVASSVLGSDGALIRRSPTGFAVFLDQPPAKARLVAEALRSAVEAKIGDPGEILPGAAGREHGGTISLGVAPIPRAGSAKESYAAAYAAAEDARVLAKETGGGNRVAVAEGGETRLMDRLTQSEAADRLRVDSPRFSARLERTRDETLGRLTADAESAPAPRAADLLSAIKSPALHRMLFETVYLDRLSGLPNRRWLFDNLDRVVGAQGYSHYIALDLDRFGTINERFGEEKADAVLQELGKVLSEAARDEQALALHLSGEEFVLLSRGGDARALAERVRLAVRNNLGVRAARRGVLDLGTGSPLTLTASFGVGDIDRRGGKSDEVLTLATAMAEAMLQRAKDRGRDRVEGAEDLETLLKRVIRVDETARSAVKRAFALAAPKAPPVPADELLNNSWRPRSEVLAAEGYNPVSKGGVLLSDFQKAGSEVYRVRSAGRAPRVLKLADTEVVENELFGRNVLRGFEIFNESLYSADAVAYSRWPLRPALVMEDLGEPKHEPLLDTDAVPLKQKRALALFALTFGVHDMNPGAFVRIGWGRSALVDFERNRTAVEVSLMPNRMLALSEHPWLSGSYLNDLADYHDAIERWKKEFARPGTQRDLAEMLARSGVPAARAAQDLKTFAANVSNIEAALVSDMALANRNFREQCSRAGLDQGQTEALSAINKAAHVSPEGGLKRDIVRFLNRRVSNSGPSRPTLALTPDEFHRLAVRRQKGLLPDDRAAVIRAHERGRLGPYSFADLRRALRELDSALPPSRS